MINLKSVSFSYTNYLNPQIKTLLFDSLDFSLPKGEKALVLGAPDSGKSTLSHLVCALVPRHGEGQLSGSVMINQKTITSLEPWNLTDSVTLVAQNPQEQLLMTTCSDEIAFPLESLGYSQSEIAFRVEKALKQWDLLRMAEVNPQQMSGGEQKRLLLAVADAIDAPIWVLDEPFDNLDQMWQEHLAQRLGSSGKTILLFASRFLECYSSFFDSYWHMGRGKLTAHTEKSLIELFDKECNTIVAPPPAAKVHARQEILCSEAQVLHTRRSLSDESPFRLAVAEFRVASDEVVALVGPNGSGKSTFSRHLCGLDLFEKGEVSIDGNVLTPTELQRRVGYLFQNPDYGIFLPTVADELSWSLKRNRRYTSAEIEQAVLEVARLYRLNVQDNPAMMSYGSRKNLQAAVYHLLQRAIIIVDELDSGLTYGDAYTIISLLKSKGAGIVIITHDKGFAKRLADRQYSIIEGNIVETEVGA